MAENSACALPDKPLLGKAMAGHALRLRGGPRGFYNWPRKGGAMKKFIAGLVLVSVIFATAVPALAVNEKRGGVMGFVAGCCFGIRAGAAYNDGKEIHWREWVRLVPFVGFVCAIWDGIDGSEGMTTSDYAKMYGSSYY
jgi:hypothetical protein